MVGWSWLELGRLSTHEWRATLWVGGLGWLVGCLKYSLLPFSLQTTTRNNTHTHTHPQLQGPPLFLDTNQPLKYTSHSTVAIAPRNFSGGVWTRRRDVPYACYDNDDALWMRARGCDMVYVCIARSILLYKPFLAHI